MRECEGVRLHYLCASVFGVECCLFYVMHCPSDDRSVRDSERRAALLHFNSDQVSIATVCLD